MSGDGEIPANILVVDDDQRLRALIQRYLSTHGFIVSTAADAESARQKLASFAYDLIVLDVMMPGTSGIDLTIELRRASATNHNTSIPILLLTARAEAEDRIEGLEAGADDYLAKPFEPRELLLRIGTILRRVRPSRPDAVLRFGNFTFDAAGGELLRDDIPVRLTAGELALLRTLAAQPGLPMSRAELGRRCRITGSDRAVDVQMARLRRKLEDDPGQPRWLLTMRGEGYVLKTGR